ncbi:hypothetical protein [Chlamydiifrater volucris]|uniref:hypothetical protein n=1 Tax=Chlamydiifrater volucris TaxID=2681470 RepID=UPI003D6C8577
MGSLLNYLYHQKQHLHCSDLKCKIFIRQISEWQVGLALAYRLNFISPYVGIKWSRAKIDFDGAYIAQPQLAAKKLDLLTWNPTLAGVNQANTANADVLRKVSVTLNKLKSRKSTGFVTGATLIDADKFAVTVEGRFIDEKAVHVNGQFRF